MKSQCRILRRERIVSHPTRALERCGACKTSPWTCRSCGTLCCEHRCSQHSYGANTALCGKCSLKGRKRTA